MSEKLDVLRGDAEWLERVATWSIHPEQASPREIAELAAEHMEARRQVIQWKNAAGGVILHMIGKLSPAEN